MDDLRLCESDYRFLCVVWDHAPVASGELVKLCTEKLGWKKPPPTRCCGSCASGAFARIRTPSSPRWCPRSRCRCTRASTCGPGVRRVAAPVPHRVLDGRALSQEEAEEIRNIIDRYSGQ